jgi:hypothetical protein
MISGARVASPTQAQKDIIDVTADYFCPKKDADQAACKARLEDVLYTASDGMSGAQQDDFATNVFFPAEQYLFDECKWKQPNDTKVRACFFNSIKGEAGGKDVLTYDSGFTGMQFQPYIDEQARRARTGAGALRIYERTATPPANLIEYIEKLKADGHPELAIHVLRLFIEASSVPALSAEPADAVAGQVIDWAKPRVDAISDDASKGVAYDAFRRTFVSGATAEKKAIFSGVPKAVWELDATPAGKEKLRGLFFSALELYKKEPKSGEHIAADPEKAFDELAAVVAPAVKEKKWPDSPPIKKITVDGDGKPTGVEFGDGSAAAAAPAGGAKAPEELIALLKIKDNPYAIAALNLLWGQIEAKEPNVATDDALRTKVKQSLIKQLWGKNAFEMSLMAVTDVNPATGDVTFDFSPQELAGDFSDPIMATIQKMQRDFTKAVADKDFVEKKVFDGDREKLARALAEAAHGIYLAHGDDFVAGAQDFFSREFTGFKDGAVVYESKAAAGGAGEAPSWLYGRGQTYLFEGSQGLALNGTLGIGFIPFFGDIFPGARGSKFGADVYFQFKYGHGLAKYTRPSDVLLMQRYGNRTFASIDSAFGGFFYDTGVGKLVIDGGLIDGLLGGAIRFLHPDYRAALAVGKGSSLTYNPDKPEQFNIEDDVALNLSAEGGFKPHPSLLLAGEFAFQHVFDDKKSDSLDLAALGEWSIPKALGLGIGYLQLYSGQFKPYIGTHTFHPYLFWAVKAGGVTWKPSLAYEHALTDTGDTRQLAGHSFSTGSTPTGSDMDVDPWSPYPHNRFEAMLEIKFPWGGKIKGGYRLTAPTGAATDHCGLLGFEYDILK